MLDLLGFKELLERFTRLEERQENLRVSLTSLRKLVKHTRRDVGQFSQLGPFKILSWL